MNFKKYIIRNQIIKLIKIIDDKENKDILKEMLLKYEIPEFHKDILNHRKCIKCGEIKHEDEFVLYRKDWGDHGFAISHICIECDDYAKAEKYLQMQIDSVSDKKDYSVIKPEHIEFKKIILKLKRKLTQLKKEKS